MNKKIIQLLALVLVLAGMIVAVVLLRGGNEASTGEESSASDSIYITGSDPAPFVKQVQIKNETGAYTIVNGNLNAIQQANSPAPNYTLSGAESLPVSSALLAAPINSAAALTAKSIVTQGDFATYGLDKPRATVTVVYENATATILVGNDAPGGEGTYVANSGSDTVYLAQSTPVADFLKPRLDYMDKVVTGGTAQTTSFTKLTLSGTAYPEPIVVQATPETTMEAGGISFGTHSIVSPVSAGMDMQDGLPSLLSVFGLTADAVVADNTDPATLEKYGLAEPYATAIVVVDNKADAPVVDNFTLNVSQPDAQGVVYLTKDGTPLVYSLSAEAVPWLGKSLFDLMEKTAILPSIDAVASVVVDTQDKSYTFNLTGEGDTLAVTLDGKEVDIKNFKQLYQTLISARYEEQATGEPTGEPVLRYTYRYRDSGKASDIVQFYPGPSRRAFIKLGTGTLFFTQSVYVDRVLEDIVKIAMGQDVKSYF